MWLDIYPRRLRLSAPTMSNWPFLRALWEEINLFEQKNSVRNHNSLASSNSLYAASFEPNPLSPSLGSTCAMKRVPTKDMLAAARLFLYLAATTTYLVDHRTPIAPIQFIHIEARSGLSKLQNFASILRNLSSHLEA